MTFEEYLQEEGQGAHYIRQNRKYAGLLEAWLEKESLTALQVSYTEILDFADHLKQSGKSIMMVNSVLLAVRYYFMYLQSRGQISYNPAAGIRLRGRVKTLPHGLLSKAELETLYTTYQVADARTQRNKVILSLLVFQGITTEELHKLKVGHIKLKEGKIHLPGGSQTNSRELKLEAEQVMELYEYMQQTRPGILSGRMAGRSGRKPDKYKPAEEIQALFISMNGCEAIKNSLKHLIQAIRKTNPRVRDAKQIRQSVITGWLKEKELRIVQYMAGHRCVSSTERYRESNLEDLKEALSKHHPLR
jgi:integrase/recombinase XerD